MSHKLYYVKYDIHQELGAVRKILDNLKLVEWTYVYKKVNFLGSLFSNAYLVYSYSGDDTSGKPLANEKRMYKPAVFRCYKSYTSKDMKELGIMKHTNVLKHPVFYAIPVFLCICIYMIFFKSSFATGDVFGTKKMLTKKQPISAAVQTLGNQTNVFTPTTVFPPSPTPTPTQNPVPASNPPPSPATPLSFPPQNALPVVPAQPTDVVTRADLQALLSKLQGAKTEKPEPRTIDWRKYEVESVIEVNGKAWYSIRGKLVSAKRCRDYERKGPHTHCQRCCFPGPVFFSCWCIVKFKFPDHGNNRVDHISVYNFVECVALPPVFSPSGVLFFLFAVPPGP